MASDNDESEALGTSAVCRVCKDGGREDFMILCDVCDRGFHIDCLDPKLPELPQGDWMCPECVEKGYVVVHEQEWYDKYWPSQSRFSQSAVTIPQRNEIKEI